jgi:hypothetical protein
MPLVSESTKMAASLTCKQSGCGLWSKGHKVSNERRKELSEASSGERNPFFGRKHTDEAKIRMSENHADFNGELNPLCKALKSRPEIRSLLSNNTRKRWDGLRSVSVGDVFDKLTVMGFTTDAKYKAICQCSCGNEVRVRPDLLSINKTNNCGCAPRGAWSGVGLLSTTFFGRIRRGAQVRAIPFEVTIEYLWSLYEAQKGRCVLTGMPIPFSLRTRNKNDASVDRINSKLGYIEGNVQWVHKDINKMKQEFPIEYFHTLCAMVTAQHGASK